MRARRALLYTPGDDLKKITKAAALGVDCLCMDIEDGVAVSHKVEARQTIITALQSLDFGRTERLVRINAVGSGLETADLEAVFSAGAQVHPDGFVLPKAETAGQVQWVSAQIAAAEQRLDWPDGEIALIIQIETATGLVNIREVLSADPRLQAVIFGAEDLAASMGAKRTPAGWEVFTPAARLWHTPLPSICRPSTWFISISMTRPAWKPKPARAPRWALRASRSSTPTRSSLSSAPLLPVKMRSPMPSG